jgi:regulatory LuxR family protein
MARVQYDPDAPASAERPAGLTTREEEILSLIAEDRSNEEISAKTGIAVATVEKHLVERSARPGYFAFGQGAGALIRGGGCGGSCSLSLSRRS